MNSITFKFPTIPESVNNLYFSNRGRRVMSTAGRKFKNSFVATRGGLTAVDLMKFIADNDLVYELHLWFYLKPEHLYNLTYGKSKAVKSPYKDIDTSNLVKLAEDSISKLIGVRDRNNWTVCAHKRESPEGKDFMLAVLKPLNIQEDPYAFAGRPSQATTCD